MSTKLLLFNCTNELKRCVTWQKANLSNFKESSINIFQQKSLKTKRSLGQLKTALNSQVYHFKNGFIIFQFTQHKHC